MNSILWLVPESRIWLPRLCNNKREEQDGWVGALSQMNLLPRLDGAELEELEQLKQDVNAEK